MEIKKGIGVSPGVVIGTAIVLDAEDVLVPRRQVDAAQANVEVDRLGKAIAESTAELTVLRDSFVAKHGKEVGGIFDFHLADWLRRVNRSPPLDKEILAEITRQHSSAEYAVSTVTRRKAQIFLEMQDRYLSERIKDVYDLEKRILRHLLGAKREDLSHLTRDVIVIAHDMLPSQTAALDKLHVKGFATDVGGRTSHTAIVARAMGIPAVVGLGDITAEISGGDTVIIDGNRGVLIINPDEEQLAEHREMERKQLRFEDELKTLAELPAKTLDGHEVSLWANIEFAEDIDPALARGAGGIGLYRTEFLFPAGDPTSQVKEDRYLPYTQPTPNPSAACTASRWSFAPSISARINKLKPARPAPSEIPSSAIGPSACVCMTSRCLSANSVPSCGRPFLAMSASCFP